MKSPALSLLNAIKLLLSENYGKLSATQKELLETAYQSCIYENDLISLIMDCYKFENGQFLLALDKFNIADMIREIEQEISFKLKEKRQKIKVINKLSDNMILADRLQIKRVITNFLTNAVTYSLINTVIDIEINEHEHILELNVFNKGLFSPKENLELVFEKFKTYKNSRYNKTSVGLGLYLSKHIIQMHKGKIYAKLQPDGRCLFGFKIPIKNEIHTMVTKEKDL